MTRYKFWTIVCIACGINLISNNLNAGTYFPGQIEEPEYRGDGSEFNEAHWDFEALSHIKSLYPLLKKENFSKLDKRYDSLPMYSYTYFNGTTWVQEIVLCRKEGYCDSPNDKAEQRLADQVNEF